MLRRFYSACSAPKIVPIDAASTHLRHVHFRGLTKFQQGIAIQNQFVDAFLVYKKIASKIKRAHQELAKTNTTMNDYEANLISQIIEMKPQPMVLTFEFQPTYTAGKREKNRLTESEIAAYKKDGADFAMLERGGQVTFHGPGQLVAFVILDLLSYKNMPVRCFVSNLEKSIIATLKNAPGKNGPLGLESMTTDDTGVWIDNNNKIASLGVNVQRGVTSHGIAINLSTDLTFMNKFTMCGLNDKLATSVEEQLGEKPDLETVGKVFAEELAQRLGMKVEHNLAVANE